MINWNYITTMDFASVWVYRYALLGGLIINLIYAAIGTALGLVLSALLVVGLRTRFAPLRWVLIAYVELFRNTPLLVQLFWVHFALPLVTGVNTSTYVSGLIAIVLNVTAYTAEIVRAGVDAVPTGQWEAARSLGLPKAIQWLRVVLPQAFRAVLPALTNVALGLFKGTALLSVLAIDELMLVVSRIGSQTSKPVEILTVGALIFFVVGLAISRSAALVERRLALKGR